MQGYLFTRQVDVLSMQPVVTQCHSSMRLSTCIYLAANISACVHRGWKTSELLQMVSEQPLAPQASTNKNYKSILRVLEVSKLTAQRSSTCSGSA